MLLIAQICQFSVSRSIALTCTLVTVVTMTAGCGGNAEPSTSTATAENAAQNPNASNTSAESMGTGSVASEKTTQSAGSSKHRRDEVWVDEKGQKWFGNVPMDAFFDEPYTIGNNQTPIAGATSVAAAANVGPPVVAAKSADTSDKPSTTDSSMTTAPPTTSATASPASSEGDSWPALISLMSIEEEVKSIRNFMKENVETVGTYNSSMLMIPPKAAALATLAEIAGQYPEAVSWKDDAKYIRDLAKQMNASALQRGAKDQKRILGLFEAVTDTLNRSKPAGLEEPPESDSFAEVSEMRLLMMRMEEAEKRMKTEAGTESTLGSKKEMIVHEASMLAVMAKVVTLPGYGYEDDAVFKGFGSDIVTASQAIKVAAESNDFASYESALSKVATTCQNCHSKYKND